jgi:adenine phosphoribosyltransferase
MVPDDLRKLIRDVPDFPKPGILFRDITPLLADAEGLREAARLMADPFRESGLDRVVGIESRGFILGPLVARELHAGFVPVRKPGKLPSETYRESYELEYGTDTVEMHVDAVRLGHGVLIVDDLIATGGTAVAAARLVERAGGHVAGFSFLVELGALHGRARLGDRPASAVLTY